MGFSCRGLFMLRGDSICWSVTRAAGRKVLTLRESDFGSGVQVELSKEKADRLGWALSDRAEVENIRKEAQAVADAMADAYAGKIRGLEAELKARRAGERGSVERVEALEKELEQCRKELNMIRGKWVDAITGSEAELKRLATLRTNDKERYRDQLKKAETLLMKAQALLDDNWDRALGLD
jgi:hypothetical protein